MKLLKKLSAGILIAVIILAMFNILFSPLAIEDNKVQYVRTRDLSNVPDNCIDVAILGSCQTYRNINPTVLWNDYNITSYVAGSPGQKTYIAYYYLKNLLRPKSLRY